MRALALISFVVSLSGCVSPRAAEHRTYERLQTWVGKPSDELIMKIGPPTTVTMLESGDKMISFYRKAGTSTSSNKVGSATYSDTSANWCQTNYLVNKDGIIDSANFQGNACGSH